MKTNVFEVLYDQDADTAILLYNGMPMPAAIRGADEIFRSLRMESTELAELFDQFLHLGGIPWPEQLEQMSLAESHEWMKRSLEHCAAGLKAGYKNALEFAKIAGPTDQYAFFKAAGAGKLKEFNTTLLQLVEESRSLNADKATTPQAILESLDAAFESNEWDLSAAKEQVRQDLGLGVVQKPSIRI